MWIVFAFGSAVFAGITSVLAKCGIRKTDSTVATAVRTVVVLAFSWMMVFAAGSQKDIYAIDRKTWTFLILSGLATGASWLCYFKALQMGDINKVVPIDKSSTVLTIIFAFVFLNEGINFQKAAGVVLIAAGTFLIIEKKGSVPEKGDREKLALIRRTFGCFRKPDVNTRKSGHKRRRVKSRNGNTHGSCAYNGVDYGFCRREDGKAEMHIWQGTGFYLPLRSGNRRLLAVLLQGAAGRPCQRCGTD